MKTAIRVAAVLIAVFVSLPVAAQQRVVLPAKDRPLTLNARTLFQVGAIEGEDYETFANVTDVAFDARGNLYVLDTGAHRIVVFDANGKFVRTIGREGGGPGEFGMPMGMTVLGTGELVVNDATRGTLQVFSGRGDFLRTVPIANDFGRATGRMRASTGGSLITETMQLRQLTDGQRTNLQRLQLPPRSVARLTLGDSATGRRLFNAAPRELKMKDAQVSKGGQMRISIGGTAFEPSLLWTPLPDGGVAALNTEQYRISLADAEGRPRRYLERPVEPRKVTDADKKLFLEARKQGAGQAFMMAYAVGSSAAGGRPGAAPPAPSMNVGKGMASMKEEDVTWNDVIPVITALGTDSWGRLWVQRSDASQQDGAIDVIDARLQYLGTLSRQAMPRAFGPDGRVAYIERDDLDVQHVVVKQIAR